MRKSRAYRSNNVKSQAAVVGMATACVLWVHTGDPRANHCAAAYRKAMGLNLKERSSGRWQDALRLTKRGPSRARGEDSTE